MMIHKCEAGQWGGSLIAVLGCWMLIVSGQARSAEPEFSLTLRSRQEQPKDSGRFTVVTRPEKWNPRETAVIVCDVWDLHHCRNAVKRLEEFAPRLNQVIKVARERGATIIHSPSDCMEPYASHAARKRAISTPKAGSIPPRIGEWCNRIPAEERGVYPVDQSDGGEDDDPIEHEAWAAQLSSIGRNPKMPWKKQLEVIEIDADRDFISDRGEEVWNILEDRGIKNVLLAGVHVNMCVLGRPFGLRQMVANGKNTALIRDMTDSMYNPKRWPYVDHFTGTDLIVSHIEKYVCPTISSDQFLGGAPFKSQWDKREASEPRITQEPEQVMRQGDQEHWRSVVLGADRATATLKPLQDTKGIVWYRAALRVPRSWVGLLRVVVADPSGIQGVKFWFNGEPIPATTGASGAYLFDVAARSISPDDTNLVVFRVEHERGGTGLMAAPRASRYPDGPPIVLRGSWQFRLGDDPAWSNLPLPSRFGIGSDPFFDLPDPS